MTSARAFEDPAKAVLDFSKQTGLSIKEASRWVTVERAEAMAVWLAGVAEHGGWRGQMVVRFARTRFGARCLVAYLLTKDV